MLADKGSMAMKGNGRDVASHFTVDCRWFSSSGHVTSDTGYDARGRALHSRSKLTVNFTKCLWQALEVGGAHPLSEIKGKFVLIVGTYGILLARFTHSLSEVSLNVSSSEIFTHVIPESIRAKLFLVIIDQRSGTPVDNIGYTKI